MEGSEHEIKKALITTVMTDLQIKFTGNYILFSRNFTKITIFLKKIKKKMPFGLLFSSDILYMRCTCFNF
jgi:hypothetical protein